MIKMIAGIYGYRNKDGAVEAKTVKSEPFSCTTEEEARLVGLRVAEYVQEDYGDEDSGEKPLENMTKKELTEIAEALGVELPKKATNPQIVALIRAARTEHESQGDDEDGDDEDAPNPGAAMPE